VHAQRHSPARNKYPITKESIEERKKYSAEMKKRYSLSVKVVILDERGRCLLLKRSDTSRANAARWDLPGGKIDPGENFDEALLREVYEETGLNISLKKVAGAAESEKPDIKIAYLIMEGRVKSDKKIKLSLEHDEFIWAYPDNLCDINLVPQFRTFLESYLKKEEAL